MASPLTPSEEAALRELLPPDERTGDLAEDLTRAARVAMQRRKRNTEVGGAVLVALHRELRSWRGVAERTGIPLRTARRWAEPPPEAE